MTKLKIFSDGASRGNPGEAGIGVVIYSQGGEKIAEIAEYIGTETNNVAEYKALIRGLEEAVAIQGDEIEVYADSELMVKQMKGLYKVKNPGLQPLYQTAKGLSLKFSSFAITHVLREKNREADKLANQGIEDKNKTVKKAFKQPTLFDFPEDNSKGVSELLAFGKSLKLVKREILQNQELSITTSEEKMIFLLKGKIQVIKNQDLTILTESQALIIDEASLCLIKAEETSVLLEISSSKHGDFITEI